MIIENNKYYIKKTNMEKLVYVNRKNTNSKKWDGIKDKFLKDDLLPFWIADMDFVAPLSVRNALSKYIKKGVYGYYKIDASYYDSFVKWEKNIHNRMIKKQWIRFSPGVVPAINWLIQILTDVGDSILVMLPVYYPFFEAVKNNNRKLVTTDLLNDNNVWKIDYVDLEYKIKLNNVKMIIFCSPHNPIGRVWTKNEIKKVVEIAKRNDVYIISDEIHHDIIGERYKHISILEFNNYKKIISLMSASKTFNIAGLKNSMVLIKNDEIRKKYDDYFKKLRIAEGCSIGYIATTEAYKNGKDWLYLLKKQIWSNYEYIKSKLLNKLPELVIADLEGTYLMWIDFSFYVKNKNIKQIMEKNVKIAVDYGEWFGSEKYKKSIRVNLATSFSNIKILVERILENFIS